MNRFKRSEENKISVLKVKFTIFNRLQSKLQTDSGNGRNPSIVLY